MSEIIWDLALIQKYNHSGPRYTLTQQRWSLTKITPMKILFVLQLVTLSVRFRFMCIFRFAINFAISVAVIK